MRALLLALCLVAGARASAQTASEGQKKYDAGDYTGAAAVFQTLCEREPSEPAWRYDLGNALFKAGRLGPAVASYQRAFALAPRDRDIRFNLDFALKRAGEELVPPGMPPVLFVAFHLASDRELAGLHWLGCWAALLLAAAWLLRPERRETLLPWTLGALALWAFAGSWWGARAALMPSRLAVVVQSTAELRSGPGESYNVSFTVPEGRRVEVLSDDSEWLEVALSKEGAKGFVRASAVEKL